MIIAEELEAKSKLYSQNTGKSTNKITLQIEDRILTKRKFNICIFPWLSILQLKKQIEKANFIKNATHHNFRLFYKNIEMNSDRRRIMDYHVQPDSVVVVQLKNQTDLSNGILNPYKIFENTPSQVTELLMKVLDGINVGSAPKLTPQGTSGTYILENSLKKKIGIFKPYDEEAFAPNNPRNYIGKLGSEGIRKGILSGQSATREVAAYILSAYGSLNTNINYHQVPTTTYVQFYHPSFSKKQIITSQPINCSKQCQLATCKNTTKHGSLQEFVQYNDVIGNFGSNMFTIEEVHKIAILDLRILNCDRNQGNILVRKLAKKSEQTKSNIYYQLIPIDHGLSFPDNFQIYEHQMTWMQFAQSKQPFTQSELEFIKGINPLKDCKILRQKLGFRDICLRNFRIAETLLKKAAEAGFSAFQIGKITYRKSANDDSEEEEVQKKKKVRSDLEDLVIQAQRLYNIFMQTKDLETGLVRQQTNLDEVQQHYLEKEEESEYKQSQASSDEVDSAENIGIFEQNKEVEDSLNKLPEITQNEKKDSSETPTTNDSDLHFETQTKKSIEKQNISIIESKKTILSHLNNLKTKNSLKLKKKISLPQLKKKNTSEYELKQKERRLREGPNGVSKPRFRKSQQCWNETFFYYFQQILDTFLLQKKPSKLHNQ